MHALDDLISEYERSLRLARKAWARATGADRELLAGMAALDKLQPPGAPAARQVLLRAGRLGRRLRRAKEAGAGD